MDFAKAVAQCSTRYVLSDSLTGLCTALAYSKGAQALACADLLHVPAERVWVEWCDAPWFAELRQAGFDVSVSGWAGMGRHGALVTSSPDGRRGSIRSFWAVGEGDANVLAGCMEAYFDLDVEEGEAPAPPDGIERPTLRVNDRTGADVDLLHRCFRFRYERTWADYYERATLSPEQRSALARHALGTIAIDIPMLMAFFLLLATRTGLPQRPSSFGRLNHLRTGAGKAPLLEHVEVLAPILPDYHPSCGAEEGSGRRGPRLHRVRGHLVRRGSQLFWRMPHLRGSARSGVVQSRTVTWTFDETCARSQALREARGRTSRFSANETGRAAAAAGSAVQ